MLNGSIDGRQDPPKAGVHPVDVGQLAQSVTPKEVIRYRFRQVTTRAPDPPQRNESVIPLDTAVNSLHTSREGYSQELGSWSKG